MKLSQSLLWKIYLLIVFIALTISIIFSQKTNIKDGFGCDDYLTLKSGFTVIHENGSKEKVSLPAMVKASPGETLRVMFTLPDNISDGSSLFVYSKRQNISVTIAGQPVADNNTSLNFGSDSHKPADNTTGSDSLKPANNTAGSDSGVLKSNPSAWHIFSLNKSYSSQEAVIYINAQEVSYLGCINPIYIGDKTSIIYHLLHISGFPVVIGLLLIIGGMVLISFSIISIHSVHRPHYFFMGVYTLFTGLWFIFQSRIRQLYISNLDFAQNMDLLCLVIFPLAFVIFIYLAEEKKFTNLFIPIFIFDIISISSVLYLVFTGFSAADKIFNFEMIYLFINILLLIVSMILIHITDHHKAKELSWLWLGTLFFCLGGLVDMITRMFDRVSESDRGLAAGTLIFSIISIYHYINRQKTDNHERQKAFIENEEKTSFLTDMSHAIRTPVNTIMGMNTLIARESDNPAIQKYSNDMLTSCNSLISIIDDILDFSKTENNSIKLTPTPYSLASLVTDCYNIISPRAQKKGLSIYIKTNDSLPSKLLGDELRIRQIIINLLTNAVKYTEKGSITLDIDFEANNTNSSKNKSKRKKKTLKSSDINESINKNSITLIIKVSDTGIGISKENINKIFNSYNRIDEIKNTTEGTGLGLTITKHLILLMNGTISVNSTYKKGSEFLVEFPQTVINSEPLGDFGKNITNYASKERTKINWFYAPDANVLAVDDVTMNLKVLIGMLAPTCMHIDSAMNGQECLIKCNQKKYDLIFLDDMMPGMDGMEVFSHLQTDEYSTFNKNTPVIMLTANAVSGAEQMYLDAGFTAYISKPIDEEKLMNAVSSNLPQNLKRPADEISADNVIHNNFENNTSLSPNTTLSNDEKMDLLGKFLDTESGLSYCIDDTDFYLDMLKEYITSTRTDSLNETFNTKDIDNYRVNVHALKSTSKTIGALILSNEAKKLEDAAKENNISYINEHHQKMMKHYLKLLDKIKEIIF